MISVKRRYPKIGNWAKEMTTAGFEPATFRVINCKATALATAPRSRKACCWGEADVRMYTKQDVLKAYNFSYKHHNADSNDEQFELMEWSEA